jgi:chemotaxis protein MotB
MARMRRRGENGLDAWPGYVDALSTLLMVIIFVLLVFVLAQAFLTATLAGRNETLVQVRTELQRLTNALSLEKGQNVDLQVSISKLNRDLATTLAARDTLNSQLAVLTKSAQADRATIAARTAELANVQTELNRTVTTDQATIAARNAELARLQAELNKIVTADQATIAARTAEVAKLQEELNKTVTIDKATITARLADIARLESQTQALMALRDELEKKAQNAAAAAMTEQERRAALQVQLASEQKLGETAKAQIALLNQQVAELRAQFASVQDALGIEKLRAHDKDLEITNLGAKLNAALVEKVEELRQYRSEFFGKLRTLLADKPGIQVVGDRFVFQSEVLFAVSKAELTPAGAAQMKDIAATIRDIAATIPPELRWILRVDGHTDPQPLKGGIFVSNWELSSARAITVVKLLISFGVPPEHLAATGFGEFQPFGPGDTEDAFAKDRRIELRLTDR